MGYIAKAYSYIEKKETVDVGLDSDDTSFLFRVSSECAKNVLDIIKDYIYASKQRLLEELRNI